MHNSYFSTSLTGLLAVTLSFVAGLGRCEGNESDDLAVGRQLVNKWSQSIEPISRLSVRYTKQEFNHVFEMVKVSSGFCAFDGVDRWLVREGEPTNDELERVKAVSPHPQLRSGREFRHGERRHRFLLVNTASILMNENEQFSKFVEYRTSPPSALMPENQFVFGFWNGFQRWLRQETEPTSMVPLFLPKTSLLGLYEIRSVNQTTLGMRVRFQPKKEDQYTTAVGRIEAFFQADSKLPHVVRYVNERFETRLFFEAPRISDQAEIDDATFRLPPHAKCRKETEGQFK